MAARALRQREAMSLFALAFHKPEDIEKATRPPAKPSRSRKWWKPGGGE